MVLLCFFLALLYLFLIVRVLEFGLKLSFEFDDKWWGGVSFWLTWVVGWLFGPPLVVAYCLGAFNGA